MSKAIDISGCKFGMLTALSNTGRTCRSKSHYWLCQCECGNTKEIIAASLRNGATVSCGCFGKEQRRKARTSHAMCGTPEYNTWDSMIQRCTNPKSTNYQNYGGRGIRVCDSWMVFENFIADMGIKPNPKFSIDRIDNDKGYEPTNCRWAGAATQARNKRTPAANTSGVVGVRFNLRANKWVAYINVDDKQVHLGRFKTMEEACKARNLAEPKYWGIGQIGMKVESDSTHYIKDSNET